MNAMMLRRLHLAGAILFLLTGIAHTIGQYAPGPPDRVVDGVTGMMRHARVAGSGFTLYDIMMCWGALYGAMSFVFGLHMLFVARAAGAALPVLRASARIGALAAVFQAVISLSYHTPPPAFFMLPAALLLGLAGYARVVE